MPKSFKVGENTYNIPDDKIGLFLKDFPNATEIKKEKGFFETLPTRALEGAKIYGKQMLKTGFDPFQIARPLQEIGAVVGEKAKEEVYKVLPEPIDVRGQMGRTMIGEAARILADPVTWLAGGFTAIERQAVKKVIPKVTEEAIPIFSKATKTEKAIELGKKLIGKEGEIAKIKKISEALRGEFKKLSMLKTKPMTFDEFMKSEESMSEVLKSLHQHTARLKGLGLANEAAGRNYLKRLEKAVRIRDIEELETMEKALELFEKGKYGEAQVMAEQTLQYLHMDEIYSKNMEFYDNAYRQYLGKFKSQIPKEAQEVRHIKRMYEKALEVATGKMPEKLPFEMKTEKPLQQVLKTAQQAKISDEVSKEINRIKTTELESVPGIVNKAKEAGMTDDVLNLDIQKRFSDTMGELMVKFGVKRDPEVPLIDQMNELVYLNKIDMVKDVIPTLKKHNISTFEFLSLTRGSLKQNARALNIQSQISRRLNKIVKGSPEEEKAFKELAQTIQPRYGLFSRVTNIWRGGLVGQLATAMRNFITQTGRIGMDSLTSTFEMGLQKVYGKGVTTHPVDEFRKLGNIFWQMRRKNYKQTKALMDDIFKKYPGEQNKLFNLYSSDVALKTAGKQTSVILKPIDQLLDVGEKGVAYVNVLNRFQEYVIRRSVFQIDLERRLFNKGISLKEIIKSNKYDVIDLKDIKSSVQAALEATWAKSPAYDTFAYNLMKITNRPPFTLVVPFQRFMYNAVKHMHEYSPSGLVHGVGTLFTKNPNTKMVARGITGTLQFLAAYQLRNSKYAGDRWYEVKVPKEGIGADIMKLVGAKEGEQFSLLPFNPFAAHFFVAEIISRMNKGTLGDMDTRDYAFGLLSTSMRAGAGLYVLDKFLNLLSGDVTSQNKFIQWAKEFSGEIIGGFAQPLNTFKDIAAEFDESQKVMKDTRTEPLWGPLKEKIPDQILEGIGVEPVKMERFIPTRKKPLKRRLPLLRQLSGIGFTEAPNVAQSELTRLGFRYNEVYPKMKTRELQNYVVREMGRLFEEIMIPEVNSKEYKAMSDKEKGYHIRELLMLIRKYAKADALDKHPEAEEIEQKLRDEFQYEPKRKRQFLEELYQNREKLQ